MPGHNNWFQVDLDKIDLIFNPYPFEDLPIKDAAALTARLIHSKYNNIYLGLSGGYDSEFIANTLLENTIPFKPIIFVDPHANETDYALYFCRTNKLNPIVIERDLTIGRLPKVMGDLVSDFPAREFKSAINIFLASKVAQEGGHFLSGAGVPSEDTVYPLPPTQNIKFMTGSFYIDVLFGDKHPNNFYTYTPEILYSYVKNMDRSLNIQEAKAKLYNSIFRAKAKSIYLHFIADHPCNDVIASERFIEKGTYDSFLEFLKKN